MSNKVGLIKNVLSYGLGIIGIVLCALLFAGPNADGTTVAEQEAFRDGWQLGAAVSFTGILMVACVAIALIFFVVQLISNPKKTVMSIIGIVIALFLFLIMWLVGSSDTNESLQLTQDVQVNDSTLGSVNAGLWTAMIAVLVGAVLFMYDLLKSLIKR